MTEKTTAVAVRSEPELGITPRTISEAKEMCDILVGSGLLPNEIKSSKAAFAILQYGAEIGLKPMTALRQIFVVKGKPAPSAQLMHGMALKHPDCDYFRVGDADGMAVVKVRRKSWPQGEFDTFTYSMDDAKTAGLLGSGTWRNHPKAMLRNRVIASAARAVFPDVLANMYEPDEVAHFSEPKQRPKQDARPQGQQRQAEPRDDGDVVDGEMVSTPPQAAWPDHTGAAAKLVAELTKRGIEVDTLNAFLKHAERAPMPTDDAGADAFGGQFFSGGGLEAFKAWEKANAPKTTLGGALDSLHERLRDECEISPEDFAKYLKACNLAEVTTDAAAEKAEAWFFGAGDNGGRIEDYRAWAGHTAGGDDEDDPIPF